ncbi:dual specificity protein phosphatase 1-like [Tubulanus polymorphus]|uniref:dual specificity protein phosphatase 1-like n=1 Tax=Tubulanus polymorphus TaxID=672921 RepID=UPI003DA44238
MAKTPAISADKLKELIETNPNEQILIDCRPFLVFAKSHISSSFNSLCPTIVKRRVGNRLPLENAVPCQSAREKLMSGLQDTVILYDEETIDIGSLSDDSTLLQVARCLTERAGITALYFLKGGFKQFARQFNHLCNTSQRPFPNKVHGFSPSSSVSMAINSSQEPVEIAPHLFLGSSQHAKHREQLLELGITALLNVSQHEVEQFQHFLYLNIPIRDNNSSDISTWFDEAINFIDDVKRSDGKVLLHCHAGISRSPTICIAYLMRNYNLNLQQAYDLVKSRRNVICPNAYFMVQLVEYEAKLADDKIRDEKQQNIKLPAAAVQKTKTVVVDTSKISIPLESKIKLNVPPPPTSCVHQAKTVFDFSAAHVQYLQEQTSELDLRPPLSPCRLTTGFHAFPLASPISSPLTPLMSPS